MVGYHSRYLLGGESKTERGKTKMERKREKKQLRKGLGDKLQASGGLLCSTQGTR